MKNIVKIGCLCMSTGLLVACTNQTDKGNSSETLKSQTTSTSEWGSDSISEYEQVVAKAFDETCYQPIIKKYQAFIKDTNQRIESINSLAFLANQAYYEGVSYTTLDIDKNNIPELLIGLKSTENRFTLLDIYTANAEGELKRLTNEENKLNMIGERMNIWPLEDGSLLYRSSGSAVDHHYILYQFNEKGTALTVLSEPSDEEVGKLPAALDFNQLSWTSISAPYEVSQGEADKESASSEMTVDAILQGDLSSIEGKWRNQAGSEIIISGENVTYSADNVEASINRSTLESEGGVVKASLSFGMSGARMILTPKGVAIGEQYLSGESDTNEDRIIIGQSIGMPEEVYYRTE